MRRPYAIAIITALAFAATLVQAAWPEKPLQLIVAYPPGGLTDALARAVAKPLGERLKQAVVVQNVPGGGPNRVSHFFRLNGPRFSTIFNARRVTFFCSP